MLPHQISASGDKLHRLCITNVNVVATFGGSDKKEKATVLHIQIDEFGSTDLPECWHLTNCTLYLSTEYNTGSDNNDLIGQTPLLKCSSIKVHHTISQRPDYVFGEWEAMMRVRQAACDLEENLNLPVTGHVVTVQGTTIFFDPSLDLVPNINTVFLDLSVMLQHVTRHLPLYWRPNSDHFFTLFTPLPIREQQENPSVWLTLEKVTFTMGNHKMESWLERMYPLWYDELSQQDLRRQILLRQRMTSSCKASNLSILLESDTLNSLLQAKNARVYIA